MDPEKLIKEIEKTIYGLEKEVLKEAQEHLQNQVRKLFQTEGRSLKVHWEPVKPDYLEWKLRKGYSEKTLHRTTTLAQSFHGKVEEERLIFGTPVKYAMFHEYGTSKMPARPIFQPLFKDLTENIDDLVEAVAEDLFGRR